MLLGGATGDYLFDGPGADTIHGGLGDDYVVLAEDGTPDTVTCGPGKDQVWGATGGNTVAADCEEVHVEPPGCGCDPRLSVRPPLAATPEPVRAQVRDTGPGR